MSVHGRILVDEVHEDTEDTPAYLTVSTWNDEIIIHIEDMDYMDHCVVSAKKEQVKEFALMLLKAVL